MKPGRICFVNDYFLKDSSATITGPMVQTYLLGTGLARRGWRVEYVATTRSSLAGRVEVHDGVRVHYVRASRRLEIGSARAVARKLAGIEADVFYQRGRSLLTGVTCDAAKRCGAKFIWGSAGEGGCQRSKYSDRQLAKKHGPKRLLFRPIYAWSDQVYESAIESAHVVIVQTEYQQQELKREFGRDSIVMKSGHVSPPETVLEKPQPPIVLWIGSIKPAKQPQLFLDLMARLHSLDARFWMVGRAEDEQWKTRLAELTQQNRKLTYPGEVPFEEVGRVYAQASIQVNTTVPDYEGLPNAFIQSWLHGVPVVSLHSDPDSVLGREGIGFRAETFDQLVERTRFLIERPAERREMGLRARRFAEKEFGMEVILDQFEAIVRGA